MGGFSADDRVAMPFFLVSVLLQVLTIVHIIRSGRDRTWIFIVALLPMVGMLAYALVELVPEIMGGRTARNMRHGAVKRLDPQRALRARLLALEAADTVENRRLAAEEYLALDAPEEALSLYRRCLTGVHADDSALLLGAARAAQAAGYPAEVLEHLDHLRAADPSFQSAEAHLLYAKALEALQRDEEAAREYAALVTYATGEEVRCRYALLLQRLGDQAGADALFQEILSRAKRGDRHYRNRESRWIELAQQSGQA